MLKNEDRAYYERRAEAELDLAQRATNPAVCKAHYDLAGCYLDLLHGKRDTADRASAA